MISADSSLHLPDFRAAEHTFNYCCKWQDAPTRRRSGEVIIQTFSPEHPAIQSVRRQDYTGFCDQELEARRELMYPVYPLDLPDL